MAVFEVERWLIAEGKEKEHDTEMRRWLTWVKGHRELFHEFRSLQKETRRHQGSYREYKENDPTIRGFSTTAR